MQCGHLAWQKCSRDAGPHGTAQTAHQARIKIQTLFWADSALLSKIQQLSALFSFLSESCLFVLICQGCEILAAHVNGATMFGLNLPEQPQPQGSVFCHTCQQRHLTHLCASLSLSVNTSASTKTKTGNAIAKLCTVSIHEFGQHESTCKTGYQQPTTHCPWHRTAHHNTERRSTAQHSTAQHSTAQHSTAQHSPAQHCTA